MGNLLGHYLSFHSLTNCMTFQIIIRYSVHLDQHF